ncbi:MAG: hypothetical protein HC927_07615, partial [Deltaproteobacteria bacterium]|nr:hypothetical protein [Deltaproteobacteria bacterium]
MLDLNYTLTANRQFNDYKYSRDWVDEETYRLDLIEFCKPHYTILITVRRERYKDRTLCRIQELTGWRPQEAFFNPYDRQPPECKELPLLNDIFPRHGLPGEGASYLAIESNNANVAMYRRHGILATEIARLG